MQRDMSEEEETIASRSNRQAEEAKNLEVRRAEIQCNQFTIRSMNLHRLVLFILFFLHTCVEEKKCFCFCLRTIHSYLTCPNSIKCGFM